MLSCQFFQFFYKKPPSAMLIFYVKSVKTTLNGLWAKKVNRMHLCFFRCFMKKLLLSCPYFVNPQNQAWLEVCVTPESNFFILFLFLFENDFYVPVVNYFSNVTWTLFICVRSSDMCYFFLLLQLKKRKNSFFLKKRRWKSIMFYLPRGV